MEISYKLINNRILMTNLRRIHHGRILIDQITNHQYSSQKSPEKLPSSALIQLHRIKKLIPPKR